MLEPDDKDLVKRCLTGDLKAFETILARYQKPVFNVALRVLSNTADAADVTQAAFLKAYEKLNSYDHHYKFFSWLYRILVNECLNVQRSRRSQEPLNSGLATRDDPHRDAEQSELRASVQSALLRLPPAYREVVVLRHYAGLSYVEIAEALGVPEKTVKSRLYSARQRLGEDLLSWRNAS